MSPAQSAIWYRETYGGRRFEQSWGFEDLWRDRPWDREERMRREIINAVVRFVKNFKKK